MKPGDLVRYAPNWDPGDCKGWDPETQSSMGLVLEIVDTVATVKWSTNGRSDFMTIPLNKLEVLSEAG
jgi:hypothetical protein